MSIKAIAVGLVRTTKIIELLIARNEVVRFIKKACMNYDFMHAFLGEAFLFFRHPFM